MAIWFGGLGGHALVEKGLADEFLDFYVRPRPTAASGPDGGFIDVETAPPQSLQHRPTPTLRMEVIKRDRYACRACGENPRKNEHIVLHVHHIRLHSKGGLTEKWNLITLCHTCHDGLKPHNEPTLFALIDAPKSPDAEGMRYELDRGTLAFKRVVERIRKRISKTSASGASATKAKTAKRKKGKTKAKKARRKGK